MKNEARRRAREAFLHSSFCILHFSLLYSSPLRSFEELRDLLAVSEPHVGLLPVRTPPREAALPLYFAVGHGCPDALDLRAEQLLDRLLDFDLVRAGCHLEHDRPPVFAQDRGLLGDEGAPNHVGELHASTSCSRSTAARVAMIRPASMTSRAVTRFDSTKRTPSMLRTESASLSSRLTSTSSVLRAAPRPFNISAAAFVFASEAASASTTVSAPSPSFWASAARRAPSSTFRGRAYS